MPPVAPSLPGDTILSGNSTVRPAVRRPLGRGCGVAGWTLLLGLFAVPGVSSVTTVITTDLHGRHVSAGEVVPREYACSGTSARVCPTAWRCHADLQGGSQSSLLTHQPCLESVLRVLTPARGVGLGGLAQSGGCKVERHCGFD